MRDHFVLVFCFLFFSSLCYCGIQSDSSKINLLDLTNLGLGLVVLGSVLLLVVKLIQEIIYCLLERYRKYESVKKDISKLLLDSGITTHHRARKSKVQLAE